MSDVNSNQEFPVPMVWTRRLAILMACCLLSGCGKTLSTSATEQLLASNAVDRSVARIDFTAMAGKSVYFDTSYIKNIKGLGFVNSEYITSALRQQLVAADCRVVENPEDAEFVVEARVGALGIDKHEVTYGIPASTAITDAASLVPSLNAVPSIPEMAFAKKSDQSGAAKISVFAFNRETREPIWQSGVSEGRSFAKDFWIAGAGPFQSGTIYESAQFAGSSFGWMWWRRDRDRSAQERGRVKYFDEFSFPPEEGPSLADVQPRADTQPQTDSAEPDGDQSTNAVTTAAKATGDAAHETPAVDQSVEQPTSDSGGLADVAAPGEKRAEPDQAQESAAVVQVDSAAQKPADDDRDSSSQTPAVVPPEQSAATGNPSVAAARVESRQELSVTPDATDGAAINAGFTTSVQIPEQFAGPRSPFQSELRGDAGDGAATDDGDPLKIFWSPTAVFGRPDRVSGASESPAAAGTSAIEPQVTVPAN